MSELLREFIDNGMTDQEALAHIGARHGWDYRVVGRSGGDWVENYKQPNGMQVDLVWENMVLTKVYRGTRASKVEARGDQYTGPELVKIAAMFLEDPE